MMEKFNLDFSNKNILLPTEEQYKMQLLSKIETFIKRLRWRAINFSVEGENAVPYDDTINYGLRSPNCLHPVRELENFENDLFDLVNKIKFRKVNCDFQSHIRNEMQQIRKCETACFY